MLYEGCERHLAFENLIKITHVVNRDKAYWFMLTITLDVLPPTFVAVGGFYLGKPIDGSILEQLDCFLMCDCGF